MFSNIAYFQKEKFSVPQKITIFAAVKPIILNHMKRTIMTFAAAMMIFAAGAQTPLNKTVRFQKDSVNISESQKLIIANIAEYMTRNPDKKIIIGGYTSATTAVANVNSICEERAANVKKYLEEQHNIPAERLVAIGVGVSTKYDEPEFNEYVSFYK
jgi:Outer membrane protein and related peptidoglycan-associated (lipo)proteins